VRAEIPDMADRSSQEDTMTSSAALKVAKKGLRSLMKQKLQSISKKSIDAQSNLLRASVKPLN
jgi:hypothetical protein